jgi:hypothetical protein
MLLSVYVYLVLSFVLDPSFEELDGPTVSALRRAIAVVKQIRSDIGWVTKNILSRAPPCFGRRVKTLYFQSLASTYPH